MPHNKTYIPDDMPEFTLRLETGNLNLVPHDGQIEIEFEDGTAIVLSIQPTGIRSLHKDRLYVAKYRNKDGSLQPNGHRFGNHDTMTAALTNILNRRIIDGAVIRTGEYMTLTFRG